MPLFKKSDTDTDDDMVDLSSGANAWWADRDELERVFVPKRRGLASNGAEAPSGGDQSPSTEPTFESQYSTESLFNWASSPEPDDPTIGGRGVPLDPYRVLGLEPGASLSEVVAAHRALAKKYHPDQFFSADEPERQHAAQTMATVNAAYQELRSRLLAHRHQA